MKRFAIAAASSALIAMIALPASAEDRAPTAEERTKIEAALRADGFTSWEEIELDDGHFEIDDAVAADGKKYDVRIDPQSFAITARDPD